MHVLCLIYIWRLLSVLSIDCVSDATYMGNITNDAYRYGQGIRVFIDDSIMISTMFLSPGLTKYDINKNRIVQSSTIDEFEDFIVLDGNPNYLVARATNSISVYLYHVNTLNVISKYSGEDIDDPYLVSMNNSIISLGTRKHEVQAIKGYDLIDYLYYSVYELTSNAAWPALIKKRSATSLGSTEDIHIFPDEFVIAADSVNKWLHLAHILYEDKWLHLEVKVVDPLLSGYVKKFTIYPGTVIDALQLLISNTYQHVIILYCRYFQDDCQVHIYNNLGYNDTGKVDFTLDDVESPGQRHQMALIESEDSIEDSYVLFAYYGVHTDDSMKESLYGTIFNLVGDVVYEKFIINEEQPYISGVSIMGDYFFILYGMVGGAKDVGPGYWRKIDVEGMKKGVCTFKYDANTLSESDSDSSINIVILVPCIILGIIIVAVIICVIHEYFKRKSRERSRSPSPVSNGKELKVMEGGFNEDITEKYEKASAPLQSTNDINDTLSPDYEMVTDIENKGEGQVDQKYDRIKQFLYNAMDQDMDDTEEYFGYFIENGFDSLKVVKTLSDSDLQEIGIVKIGHRRKILSAITEIEI